MAEINQEVTVGNEALGKVLDAILIDLTALTAAVNALRTDHNTLRTKLNSDGGVTDTDYAASTASAVSLTTT
jgi:hypothetical protein